MLEVAEVWVCDGSGDSFLHCGCLPLRAAALLFVFLKGLLVGKEVSPAVCAMQQHTAGGVHGDWLDGGSCAGRAGPFGSLGDLLIGLPEIWLGDAHCMSPHGWGDVGKLFATFPGVGF